MMRPLLGRRLAWPGALAAIAVLVVYLLTLAPGLTVAHAGSDGGDLIAAARTLGVPHPTGYPTYVLLAWLIGHVPVGAIAYRTNLLSAICASGTVGLLYAIGRRLLPATGATISSAAAALTLGFAPLFWSQALITEVYTLVALFSLLLVYLLVRYRESKRPAFLLLGGSVVGIGMGSHLTLLFALLPCLALLWPDRRYWMRLSVLLPLTGCLLAGLSVYAYLPLAASRHPPVNWANPQTPEGFLWLVTAAPYRQLFLPLTPEALGQRLQAWAGLLGRQTSWWGLAVAAPGAWIWWQRDRPAASFAFSWAISLVLFAFLYNTVDSHVYLISVLWVPALCWGYAASGLLNLSHRWKTPWSQAAILGTFLLPTAALALHWKHVDLSHDTAAEARVSAILESVQKDGLVVVQSDEATFSLWYGLYAQARRPDMAVINAPLLGYPWYREGVRRLYPGLYVPEPTTEHPNTDDLTYLLVIHNLPSRPVYATDPAPTWHSWFDFVRADGSPLYCVRLKLLWERRT